MQNVAKTNARLSSKETRTDKRTMATSQFKGSNRRAGIYLKKNEYDRAARDYDEAIRLEPNLEAVWSGRCWSRAILGELQTALEDCNRALQSGPNNAGTYDLRGLIHLKMG